jgi:hypothetical protein
LEKPQLINFIAKVMEDSGFKVYKNFKTSQRVIDIYAILPTTIGDFGVVVACKNYDKDFEVGVDVLREMENVAGSLKASKVAIVTSASFTNQATNYALRKNIKLVDREDLIELAKKYQDKTDTQSTLDTAQEDEVVSEDYYDYSYDSDDMDYLMRKQDEKELIYNNSNSLYPYEHSHNSNNLLSKFGGHNKSQQRASLAPLNSYYYNSKPTMNANISEILSKILANPIAVVILVVIVSYALSYLFGNVLKAGGGVGGLVEMIAALVLSYGLTYFFSERSRFFIIRGTVIFFVSLIVLIILIFI